MDSNENKYYIRTSIKDKAMKIIYRIFVIFMFAFELPLCLICGVLIFLHFLVIFPLVYLMRGKILWVDYVLDFMEWYIDFVNELAEKKGDYD